MRLDIREHVADYSYPDGPAAIERWYSADSRVAEFNSHGPALAISDNEMRARVRLAELEATPAVRDMSRKIHASPLVTLEAVHDALCGGTDRDGI